MSHEQVLDPNIILYSNQVSYKGGLVHIPLHKHRKAQIVYSAQGVIRLQVPEVGIHFASVGQGIFIASEDAHEASYSGCIQANSLYLEPELLPKSGPFQRSYIFDTTEFFIALFRKLCDLKTCADLSEQRQSMVALLLSELSQHKDKIGFLPIAKDPVVVEAQNKLVANASLKIGASQIARDMGVSEKTFQRRFVIETGFTFSDWKNRLKLKLATELLHLREPVTEISMELGFQDVSSFIRFFRKHRGVSPGKYVTSSDKQII